MCWVRFVFQHAHNAATLILLLKIHHRFSLKAWCVPWLIIFDLMENLMLWCLTDSIFHSHLFVFLIWILFHAPIILNHHKIQEIYLTDKGEKVSELIRISHFFRTSNIVIFQHISQNPSYRLHLSCLKSAEAIWTMGLHNAKSDLQVVLGSDWLRDHVTWALASNSQVDTGTVWPPVACLDQNNWIPNLLRNLIKISIWANPVCSYD